LASHFPYSSDAARWSTIEVCAAATLTAFTDCDDEEDIFFKQEVGVEDEEDNSNSADAQPTNQQDHVISHATSID
jgi:hypothetical protein